MKVTCNKCHKDLGNILKGSMLRNGIVFLCKQCEEAYKVFEDLANFNKGSSKQNKYDGKNDIPDFLKGLFDKK